MSKSLAAVFHQAGASFEQQQIPLPSLQEGEALVRVLGCTVCGSDAHTYEGRRTTPMPTILGHEIVGEIVELGRGSALKGLSGGELQVGDRVTWAIVVHCGACFFCQRGLPQKCERSVKFGHEAFAPGRELLGGLSQYCWLPQGTSIVRIPDSLSLEIACPASCATATVAAALRLAGRPHDEAVCVMGMGMLGLTTAAMARQRGAQIVVGVDMSDERLELAKRFGATHTVRPDALDELLASLPLPRGFDVVYEMSGAPAAVAAGFDCVRVGGSLALTGSVFPSRPNEWPAERIVRRNLRIFGVHNYEPADLVQAIDFLESSGGIYPFDSLVRKWLPLSKADEAFKITSGGGCIRIGVRTDDYD